MGFKNFFEGQATFEVQNCDFLLLNRLRLYNVSDVSFDEGVNQMRFTVQLRFVGLVKSVLSRYKYSIKENKNFFGILNVFYSRLALAISSIICVIALFVLNGFVFNVKVVGVDGEQAHEVATFVNAHGAKPLTLKSRSQSRAIAGEIVANFDYIAHASCKIVGSTLIFNVYSIYVAGDSMQNNDIVAKEEGIVTNVVAASGRALVKSGDVVKKGQVLIKAERQIGSIDVGVDEFGKLIQEGIYTPCRAVGVVMADVKYTEFGTGMTVEDLLSKIIARTGVQNFDKVEHFSPSAGVLEVVATVNVSIV